MPLRMITLDNGKVCSRNITNIRSDGTEFLPEELAIPSDTDEGERVYKSLERLLDSQTKHKINPPQG